jgi:hypothetical protein
VCRSKEQLVVTHFEFASAVGAVYDRAFLLKH